MGLIWDFRKFSKQGNIIVLKLTCDTGTLRQGPHLYYIPAPSFLFHFYFYFIFFFFTNVRVLLKIQETPFYPWPKETLYSARHEAAVGPRSHSQTSQSEATARSHSQKPQEKPHGFRPELPAVKLLLFTTTFPPHRL